MTKYSFNLSVKEIRPVIKDYPIGRKKNATLWDVFNDITEKITHKSRVGIIRRSILTDALHRFMKRLINSN